MNAMATAHSTAPWVLRIRVLVLTLLALAGLVTGLNLFRQWQERRAWRAACAEADRLDPGWHWNDLEESNPPVPNQRNSVVHVLAAAKLLPKQYVARLRQLERELQKVPPQHRLSPQAVARLQEVLAAAAPALVEAQKVAYCPSGRVARHDSPLVANPGLNTIPFFDVIRDLFNNHLLLQADAGNSDEALTTIRAMLYAGHPLADSHTLFGSLMAEATRQYAAKGVERVLAQGQPGSAALEMTAWLLDQELNHPLLLTAFRGERACIEDTIRALDDGLVSRAILAERQLYADGHVWVGDASIDRAINGLLGADFRLANATDELKHLTWMIECLKDSPDGLQTRSVEWQALRKGLLEGPSRSIAVYAREVFDMAVPEASMRCTALAVAAERFRLATGRWPGTLDELVPTYLTVIPRDPFTGQGLKLARRADGIVIYSIGEDGSDDGGDAGDVSIRLWDVKYRRQAPLLDKREKQPESE